jgi:hypothetical protein
MKWIGQNIYDQISRFRDDLYLEAVPTSTETDMLVVSSTGLVSKRAIDAITVDVSDFMTNGVDNRILTATGADAMNAESALTFASEILTIGNDDNGSASIKRLAHSDGDGGSLSILGGSATAGQTDKAGGDLNLKGGANTGDGAGGAITFNVTTASGSTGTTIMAYTEWLKISSAGVYAPYGFQIGHASDTTLTRASSGDLNVEGNIIYRAGGTDVPVTDGGTGASTLTDNAILTGTGTSAITAEGNLSFDSETLSIGADDDGSATIKRLAHSDEAGGLLEVRSGDGGGTDKAGGNLKVMAGRGTGSAAGGNVQVWAGGASGGGSSSSNVSNVQCASFNTDQSTRLLGDLIFEGPSPDANETTFDITDPTADRTITVPDATGTMCISGASGSNIVVLGSGTGYVNAPAAQKWYFGNTLYGFHHFNWAGVNVSMVSDSSTFTISEDYNGIAQFVPAALSKVVARVSCRPASTSDETFRVTICSADRDAGGTNTTWTALASATNETSIGVWEACDATYTGSIATSKMLAIGVGIDESSVSTGNVRFNWQLVGYLT